MVKVTSKGTVLSPTDYSWENRAVLNPGIVQTSEGTVMLYRGVGMDKVSSIGKCIVNMDLVIQRDANPAMYPEFEYESSGLEDPRIVEFEGKYYVFYTVYDGNNAQFAFASTNNLQHFEKKGVISSGIKYIDFVDIVKVRNLDPEYIFWCDYTTKYRGRDVLLWQKDACIFPKRIGGKIALLHRILPSIQIVYVDDWKDFSTEAWREHLNNLDKFELLKPKFWWEDRCIGAGSPPLETEHGWLLIYHGVQGRGEKFVYRAGAALLDLENPQKVIARLEQPLFEPSDDWEKQGEVNNVVFPTGTVLHDDDLWIYYGGADSVIGAKTVSLKGLLSELEKNKCD